MRHMVRKYEINSNLIFPGHNFILIMQLLRGYRH